MRPFPSPSLLSALLALVALKNEKSGGEGSPMEGQKYKETHRRDTETSFFALGRDSALLNTMRERKSRSFRKLIGMSTSK